MDIETLQQAAQQVGISALFISLLTGLLFSFNPVALASIPVSMAYVTKARAPRDVFVYGAMFILGLLLSHALLGAIAGFGGQAVQRVIGRHWGVIVGPWLILMGLLWPGWIKLPFKGFSFRVARATSVWGAMILGAIFAIAVCPVCTPALVVLLGVAAGSGSPTWGILLLLAFALGRAIPIVIGAGAMGLIEKRIGGIQTAQRVVEVVGGISLIAMGLYMLNAQFFWVPQLAG